MAFLCCAEDPVVESSTAGYEATTTAVYEDKKVEEYKAPEPEPAKASEPEPPAPEPTPEPAPAPAYAEPASPFVIRVDKSGGTSLGLDLDKTDKENLMVLKIGEIGLVPDFNMTAGAGEGVKVGDRIRKVNGVSGTAEEIIKKIACKEALEIELEHCVEKKITVEKKGRMLGVSLGVNDKATCITVQKIETAGVIAELNSAAEGRPSAQVKNHDKIMAIDDKPGTAPGLMSEIKGKDSFTMTLYSWSSF